MRGYKFSQKEEVAHVENLTLKMRVVDIKWRYKDEANGTITDGRFDKERKRFIDGIMCQWWVGNKLKSQKFHAELLVPWPIAQKGRNEADIWLDEMKLAKYAKR